MPSAVAEGNLPERRPEPISVWIVDHGKTHRRPERTLLEGAGGFDVDATDG